MQVCIKNIKRATIKTCEKCISILFGFYSCIILNIYTYVNHLNGFCLAIIVKYNNKYLFRNSIFCFQF